MARSALPSPSTKASIDEIDDYMSMTITEPTVSSEKETYSQRRIRKQREAEARSRPKSKAELAAAANAARDDGLSTAISSNSKGFQMMAKLGFKPGDALGASTNVNARMEPLEIVVKEDKGGVGVENERKRKFREEAIKVEGAEKKQKVEESDYRERIKTEREEKRVEGLCGVAMRVLEGLEQSEGVTRIPSKKVNVLWRGLLRDREERDRDRRMRHDLDQSLRKENYYIDPEEDEQNKRLLGRDVEDVEEEDQELDEFLALLGKERLRRLVKFLRAEHFYCFWCKTKYEDKSMDGCPGIEEDDHD